MIRRKKIAMLKRQRKAAQKIIDDTVDAETKNAAAPKRKKFMKQLNRWRQDDFERQYREDFDGYREHEPRKGWTMGPTTKPRSILENY